MAHRSCLEIFGRNWAKIKIIGTKKCNDDDDDGNDDDDDDHNNNNNNKSCGVYWILLFSCAE